MLEVNPVNTVPHKKPFANEMFKNKKIYFIPSISTNKALFQAFQQIRPCCQQISQMLQTNKKALVKLACRKETSTVHEACATLGACIPYLNLLHQPPFLTL
jgi:hypothetical protein